MPKMPPVKPRLTPPAPAARPTLSPRGAPGLAPTGKQTRLGQAVAKDSFGPRPSPRLELTGAPMMDAAPPTAARRNLKLPGVMDTDQVGVSYEWVPGVLVKDGFSMEAVLQGKLANCYMAASFAAIAQMKPELLAKAIKDNQDGTYSVSLYQPDTTFGDFQKITVEVDGRLPTRYGELTYGHNKDSGELWVAILEKAFAQLKGGYDAIGNGGAASEVLETLTGKPASYLPMSGFPTEEALFQRLVTAFENQQPVVANTDGKERQDLYQGKSLFPWHTYSVTGLSTEDGRAKVTLRNPWGRGMPDSPGLKDGEFKLDLGDFMKLYKSTTLG